MLCFGTRAARLCGQQGLGKPPTFNFLGFTHDVGHSRRGRFVVGRKTQRERFAKKLKAFGAQLARLRTSGGRAMMQYAVRHLRGHLAYYGVSGNSRSLRQYFCRASRLLLKWLNRRSQRRSIPCERFGEVLRSVLPAVRIMHNL